MILRMGGRGPGVLPPVSTHSPPGRGWEASGAGPPAVGWRGVHRPLLEALGLGAPRRGETSHGPLAAAHTRPWCGRVGLSVCAWAPVGGECTQVGPLSGRNSSPLPEPRGCFAGTAKCRGHADCPPTAGPCVLATRPHAARAPSWSQARHRERTCEHGAGRGGGSGRLGLTCVHDHA